MKRDVGGPYLSAVFVDYDNIYLSLKRKSEEAAKQFAKDAASWLREIESGALITPTHGEFSGVKRRIVMNRCYGNPVPRRNSNDNSTDMSSFPFVRHHFLRAGFEVVDCPPLTAQLKNSADIRIVMDVRDYLLHQTYFDEFIVLSGDADFTPVLHRLRQHARRTIIYANDYTAAPYAAISDGEIREADLLAVLLGERPALAAPEAPALPEPGVERAVPVSARQSTEDLRQRIIAEVVAGVRGSATPVPLEALADRALRALGHEQTIGTSWAGAGSFRDLLRQSLPAEVRLSDNPPYLAYDVQRHGIAEAPALRAPALDPAYDTYERTARAPQPAPMAPAPAPREHAPPMALQPPAYASTLAVAAPTPPPALRQRGVSLQPTQTMAARASPAEPPVAYAPPPAPASAQRGPLPQASYEPAPEPAMSSALQHSIQRITEACQAPQLSPKEYSVLFEVMAQELTENGLIGAQTLTNVADRALTRGLEIKRDDIRFTLEVVSETDPWFEQGASANLFAGRFRNFVVARCRSQGLSLSADELDLVDAWFAGGAMPQETSRRSRGGPPSAALAPQQPADQGRGSRWWSLEEGRQHVAEQRHQPLPDDQDEFPRFIKTRVRG
jgi:hypothetical protein